jgi:hypothetical protein
MVQASNRKQEIDSTPAEENAAWDATKIHEELQNLDSSTPKPRLNMAGRAS